MRLVAPAGGSAPADYKITGLKGKGKGRGKWERGGEEKREVEQGIGRVTQCVKCVNAQDHLNLTSINCI